MGLWIRCGKENAFFIIYWKKFAETEKDMARHVERESRVEGFFQIAGVVHHEFLHQGQTLNHWYYLEVLKRLRENATKKDLSCGETTPGSSIVTMCPLMYCY
jgi:hypothetical protein